MTTTDPFEFDDAAYLLGALSESERAAFEAHLPTCAACTARVHEVEGVAGLLAGVTGDEAWASAAPPPDTLLPSLLRRAAKEKRRRGRLVGGLAALAAACLVAVVIAVWPSGSSSSGRPPAASRPFQSVAPSPVQASATLTAEKWGTAIDVRCHYLPGSVDRSFTYDLIVYDRRGVKQTLGGWNLPPDRDIDFPAGTALSPSQISRIEIALPNGSAVLRLTTS